MEVDDVTRLPEHPGPDPRAHGAGRARGAIPEWVGERKDAQAYELRPPLTAKEELEGYRQWHEANDPSRKPAPTPAPRTVFTDKQVATMTAYVVEHKRKVALDELDRKTLAKATGLSEAQVKEWWIAHRAKVREAEKAKSLSSSSSATPSAPGGAK